MDHAIFSQTWITKGGVWFVFSNNYFQFLNNISRIFTRHGKTGGSGRVRVGSIGSLVKIGHWSKRIIFKRVNWVAGQTGRGLSRVASRVKLTRIFQTIFFFFFFFKVDAICQLFMSSLIVIRFSLVILLQITTKHLT